MVACFNLDFTNYISVCQCSSSVKFMKCGYIHAIFKYFSDFIYIVWIMFFEVTALYKDYFQHYVFIGTTFYTINLTMPARLKHICAVGCVKGLVKI